MKFSVTIFTERDNMANSEKVVVVERNVVIMTTADIPGQTPYRPAIQSTAPTTRVVTVDNDNSSDR